VIMFCGLAWHYNEEVLPVPTMCNNGWLYHTTNLQPFSSQSAIAVRLSPGDLPELRTAAESF